MSGCFGNSPYDRNMEQQLNQYLNEGADYELYVENVSFKFDDKMWESGLEDFFDYDKEAQKFISDCFNQNKSEQECADGIIKLYIGYKSNL